MSIFGVSPHRSISPTFKRTRAVLNGRSLEFPGGSDDLSFHQKNAFRSSWNIHLFVDGMIFIINSKKNHYHHHPKSWWNSAWNCIMKFTGEYLKSQVFQKHSWKTSKILHVTQVVIAREPYRWAVNSWFRQAGIDHSVSWTCPRR